MLFLLLMEYHMDMDFPLRINVTSTDTLCIIVAILLRPKSLRSSSSYTLRSIYKLRTLLRLCRSRAVSLCDVTAAEAPRPPVLFDSRRRRSLSFLTFRHILIEHRRGHVRVSGLIRSRSGTEPPVVPVAAMDIDLTELDRTLSNCTTGTMRGPRKTGRQQLCVVLHFRRWEMP